MINNQFKELLSFLRGPLPPPLCIFELAVAGLCMFSNLFEIALPAISIVCDESW